MKNSEYYESALRDGKKELPRQTHVLNGLKQIHKQLKSQGYQPLDSLEIVISEWETRRGSIKGAIMRLEDLVK